MRALVILLAMLAGGAFGLFAPVLVAIALNVGSMSYEAFIPVVLITVPLFAVVFAVGAGAWLSRRKAQGQPTSAK